MSTTSVMGGAVRRREDPALIRGTGVYTDDIKLSGALHVAFVRSPIARGKITRIDTKAAMQMPGVWAVYTAADVRHLGPLLAQVPAGKLRPLLADGLVNHVGEAVAMVVADSPYLARDAIEAVVVDYDSLPAVVDLKEAASDKVLIHADLKSNTTVSWKAHDWWAGVIKLDDPRPGIEEAKKRKDAVIVSLEMTNQRLIPVAIEPRSVIAEWNLGYGRFTVWSSTQVPHALMGALAKTFGLPSNSVRVIALEVGGGFGSKLNVYIDEVLVCFAARQLGRPVKFTETRREAAVSTIQGRGWVGTATLVGTKDGKILGYELEALADMGAYTQNFTQAIPLLGLWVSAGQYDIPTYWKVDTVYTNTPVTDAYRGAGRPEAIYYIERIVDAYSRQIGMDPAEVRKLNYHKTFPVANNTGLTIDSGNYVENLDKLLEAADYQGLRKMQAAARKEGRYVGIGVSSYLEICGFGPSVLAEIGFGWDSFDLPTSLSGSGLVRVNPDASVTAVIGTGPTGQSHETTWGQIISDGLGIPMERIAVKHGDTSESPMGVGTFGSRSIAVDGTATYQATQRVREKAQKIAAHMLEAAAEDIRFGDDAAFVAGSPDRSVTWKQIAGVAYRVHKGPEGIEPGLEAKASFSPSNATWPFGSHLAVVEVDTETGDVKLLRYVAMDDCGNVINPMIVDGQLHGGIAQGVGQALFEEAIYDADGNCLTTSLIDYPLPTAADLPSFELDRTVTPTDVNPMGVKGVGEAGTIGAAQTIVNAVIDALAPLGVKHIDMPLRPRRVWKAIQEAKGA
jgi:carbon-monoxide dehydrogenase large subunit